MSEYIKREDALNKFKKMPPSPTKEFIIETLNAIPAADVEPVVRGEWKKVYENTTFGAMYRCSTCGETTFNVENYKYCPKCGAHMERSGSGE